jgi:Family of unknown function (DUF7009)
MKLRIRGNSLRLRVSRAELLRIAEQGSAEDSIRFAPGTEWRYGIEVKPSGEVAAQFAPNSLRVALPRARVEQWLDDREVGIEGQQPIGDGEMLRILVEKDYTCLAPRTGEDDSDLFVNPQQTKAASR